MAEDVGVSSITGEHSKKDQICLAKKSVLCRFLCISWVLFTMPPCNVSNVSTDPLVSVYHKVYHKASVTFALVGKACFLKPPILSLKEIFPDDR